MGRNEYGELNGLCGYANVKYDERVETRRRKRSSSAPLPTPRTQYPSPSSYAKLHKPPTLHAIHERPRNRLQKRILTPSTLHLPVCLFLLEYESYPYNMRPSQFLGIYSSIDSVTAAALRHGAYTFSREGILDGSEYLSPEGRIRIVSRAVERTGVRAGVSGRTRSLSEGVVRLDIPHPDAGSGEGRRIERERVYLAVHESRHAAECVGLFAEKELAWGACLKDKVKCAVKGALVEETQYVVADNMPKVAARLVGEGRHMWFVQECEVDKVDR